MATTLEPLNDQVIVRPLAQTEETTASGLIVAKAGYNPRRPGRGIVEAAGPKTDVTAGDEVLYLQESAQYIELDQKLFAVLKNEHITARVRS